MEYRGCGAMVRKKHFACVIGLFCLLVSLRVFADDRSDAAELINSAEATFQRFVADPEMGCFLGNVADAKALVIVPQLLKVGFIFGASGGNGIVMARDKATESWSNPAFYSMGSVAWGWRTGCDRRHPAIHPNQRDLWRVDTGVRGDHPARRFDGGILRQQCRSLGCPGSSAHDQQEC